jgi:hypothetical protein
MNKIATLAALLVAFSVAVARDDKAINANCPVKGTAVKAGGPTSSYMGKTIGFC